MSAADPSPESGAAVPALPFVPRHQRSSRRTASRSLSIPHDPWAEREVVGVAVASTHGFDIARRYVTADDFYIPQCQRLFAIAPQLENVACEDRVSRAAELAGVEEAVVEALVAHRSLMHDDHGRFARRVRETARRRELMRVCGQAYNALGSGATFDEVSTDVREAVTP